MGLIKVLRLRPSSPNLKERYPSYANLFPFPESGYKGASGDVRLEVYFETKPNYLQDGGALQEFAIITQSVNSAQKFKQTYNNIDYAPLFAGKTNDQVQEYITKDFIKKIAYQKLVSEKFSLDDAQKNSENYYSIVQDPWQDEPPVTRNFGTDEYFLTNGLSVEIYWHTGTNYQFYEDEWSKGLTGGAIYSNFDGSESWNKSLLQPGKTPPVPFFQDDADKQYAKDEKKKLTKTLIAKPSAELVRKKNMSIGDQEIYTISSNEIKLKFSQKTEKFEDTGAKPDVFPGDVTDLDILSKFVTMYNSKIPNYGLEIANPDYYEDTTLEFKSPIAPVEESKQKTEDNKPTENNNPESVKFKLSVVYDKTVVIKAGQDLPKIDIYVGDPPTEEIPEFIFSGEEEVALDDEFVETEFSGDNPELVFFQDNNSTEGAIEDNNSGSQNSNGGAVGADSIKFDGRKFEKPIVSKRYPTQYYLYIDHTKMPKPKLTKQGLITTKLKVEGGLSANPNDSAADNGNGYCPTPLNGKKYHTNKGVTYAAWKRVFGSNNDKRFLDMNLTDWTKLFDQSFWTPNATSKYEAVNCLLVSFAWGGNKPKTVSNAKKLLNVDNLDSVSESEAVAALLSARAQFFINISQPGVDNNTFRVGWINAVNKFIETTYF